jgi:hypothetical protein
LAEARKRAAVLRVEQVTAEKQKAQAVAKSVTDAEQVQIDAKAQAEAERVKAESAKDQEKTARQNKALNSLQAAPVTKVTLVSSERYSEFSPEQPPVGQTITLCEAFDIANLISPKLMLATAYSGEEHGGREPLRVREIAISGVPTWTITGMIHDDFQGTQIGDIDVGQIVAQDGKLVLKLLVGPKHRLIEMLRNAVLLITTRESLSDTEDKLRKQVYFSQPLISSQMPAVPFEVFETADKDFGEKLVQRVKDIPFKNLRWEIECVLQTGASFAIKDSCQELPLRFPPTGDEPVLIEYRTVGDDDRLCLQEEAISITGTLSFRPETLSAVYVPSPDTDGLERAPFFEGFFTLDFARDPEAAKKVFMLTLKKLEPKLYEKMFDEYLAVTNKNKDREVRSLSDYDDRRNELVRALNEPIKVPGRNYNRAGGGEETYTDTKEFDQNMKKRLGDRRALESLERQKNEFLSSPAWLDIKRASGASFDNAFKTDGPFGPFTVRLKQFTANAWCGKNGPFPIQIVEPGPD